MADNKPVWPHINNQFIQQQASPPRTVAGDLLRFVVYGFLILGALRLLNLLAG